MHRLRRSRCAALAGVVAAGTLAGLVLDSGAMGSPVDVARRGPDLDVRTIGTSVRGRPIVARVVGEASATRHVIVIGCVRGTERAGEAITAALRQGDPPEGTNWWVVDRANPDGCDPGTRTRQNARGVDLNRNSSWNWGTRDKPGGTFYAGPRAWSEPEARAIRDLVDELRPAVTVWFHQHAAMVDTSSGGDHRIERRYARMVGLPAREYGTVHGSLTSWQNQRYPSATAFVVELPAGRLSAATVARHVRAIEGL